ncbi:MAG: hypothetical protein HY059_09060 [Proteobacteria bacterium]|nr:hypothetical protein [Pseudomonadota bacterium]
MKRLTSAVLALMCASATAVNAAGIMEEIGPLIARDANWGDLGKSVEAIRAGTQALFDKTNSGLGLELVQGTPLPSVLFETLLQPMTFATWGLAVGLPNGGGRLTWLERDLKTGDALGVFNRLRDAKRRLLIEQQRLEDVPHYKSIQHKDAGDDAIARIKAIVVIIDKASAIAEKLTRS